MDHYKRIIFIMSLIDNIKRNYYICVTYYSSRYQIQQIFEMKLKKSNLNLKI